MILSGLDIEWNFTAYSLIFQDLRNIDFTVVTSLTALLPVDCSLAGQGKLEVEITKDGRTIPSHLKKEGDSVYAATFTPVTVGHYQIAIAYNKAEIRGKRDLIFDLFIWVWVFILYEIVVVGVFVAPDDICEKFIFSLSSNNKS